MLLIVHGGAGNKKSDKKTLEKIHESLSAGYEIMISGGTALDAVIESITVLEDSGIFNAGLGGNLQLDGVRRLDASLMDGKNLKAGSVIGLEGIRNPVKTARLVMGMPHVMMTNTGAKKIAEANNLPALPEPDEKTFRKLERIKNETMSASEAYKKYFSTVGAAAIDANGNLASGASTGGILAMLPGRVGDTPIIGAGVYAENPTGAVSCTGTGENIIRLSLAKEITMNLKTMSPLKAARFSLKRLFKIHGEAGVIVINSRGQFTIMHTTKFMASGYINKKEIVVKESFRKISY